MSQGNCSRTAVRFFYDSETNSCRQFIYSGCGGTLNNFISAADCEQFCMSVHNHEKTAANNDDHLMDLYSVGFVLTGPLQRDKHSQKFTTVLRDYVTHSFGIKEGELRDMVVRDDNTVRFSIVSPDAREKAENISEAVCSNSWNYCFAPTFAPINK
jgi:hypothetical protein